MDLTRESTRQKLLLLILLLAALLRFPDLGSKSIWGDEATSVYVSIGQTIATDHPPAFYALSGFFVHLLGWNEFAMRFPSAFLNLLLIWALYLLGELLARLWSAYPKTLGLVTALLLAISPYFIQLSQESRPYSMISAIAAWSSYFFLVILERQRILIANPQPSRNRGTILPLLGYISVTTLGLYTHYFCWFNLLIQGTLWSYLFLTRPVKRRSLLLLLIAPTVVLLLFLPIAPKILAIVQARSSGIQASRNLLSLQYYFKQIIISLFHFASGYYFTGVGGFTGLFSRPPQAALFGLAILLSFGLFFCGLITMFIRAVKQAAWAPAIFLLVGLLISLFGALTIDTSIARQHSISAVFFFPIFALGFLTLTKRWRVIAVAGYGLIITLTLISYYSFNTHPFYRIDWRSASRYLQSQQQPDDVFYVAYAEREGYYSLKLYGLKGEMIYAKRPGLPENQSTWINPETGQRFSEGHLIRTLLSTHPRLWLVHPPIRIADEETTNPGYVVSEKKKFGRDLEICLVTVK